MQREDLLSDARFGNNTTRVENAAVLREIITAEEPNRLTFTDSGTFVEFDTRELPCGLSSIEELVVLPEGAGWIVLGDDRLCGLAFD